MARKDFDRVREIREKANEKRRLEQRAARRRTVLIQISVIVGVLVIIGAIVATIIFSNNNKVPQAVPTADGTVAILGVSDIPLSIETTAVTVGQTDAPVTLDLYEDFSCPHCADYEAQVGPVINKLIADGDVIVNYHPIRFVTNYGQAAGSAATCVATEDPANWPVFHAALFANHNQSTDGWKARDFAKFAESGGVTSTKALDCIKSEIYTDWIMTNTKAAQDNGVTSTPSLFINGKPSELLDGNGLTAAVEAAKAG